MSYGNQNKTINIIRSLLNISDNVNINNSLNNIIFTVKEIKDNTLSKLIEELSIIHSDNIKFFISQDISYINNTLFIKDSSILNTCVILLEDSHFPYSIVNNYFFTKNITYNNTLVETKFKIVDKLPFLFISEENTFKNCEIVNNMALSTEVSKGLFPYSYKRKYAIDLSKTNSNNIALTIAEYLKDITEVDYILLLKEVLPYSSTKDGKYEEVFNNLLNFGKIKFNVDYLNITNKINISVKEMCTSISDRKNFFKFKSDRVIGLLTDKDKIFYYSKYYKAYHKKTIVANTTKEGVFFFENISDEQLFICKLLLDKSSKLIDVDSIQNVFRIDDYIDVLTKNYKYELVNKNSLTKYYITVNDLLEYLNKYYLGYMPSYEPYAFYETSKQGLKALDIDINILNIINNKDEINLRYYPITNYKPILQNTIANYTYSDIDLLIYSIKNNNLRVFKKFTEIESIESNIELFKWYTGIDIDITKYTGKKIMILNDSIKNKVQEYKNILEDRDKYFNDNNKLFKYIYKGSYNEFDLLQDLKEDIINGK